MGQKFVKGINDLETWCKLNNRMDLLAEWDETNEIRPEEVSYGSHKIVKWICSQGHHYEKPIHNRCKGTGCYVCSGSNFVHRKKIFEEYPELIYELATNKNSYESVKSITCGSSKKIYWRCQQGHIYEMSVANKVRSKECPFCNNKRVLAGFNDLETWCKTNGRNQVLKDWDYSKNSFNPSEITSGSNRKIWFKCHICGYEWRTVLGSRTNQHTDCRMCSRRISSSFPEQCIYYYISNYFSDAENGNRAVLDGRELDIWVPSLKFAVEYDGKKWHKDSQRDLGKDQLCKDRGIILYRVREKGCQRLESIDSVVYEYDYKDWDSLSLIISEILFDLGVKEPNVNITRDEYLIKENYYTQSISNSLELIHPELAKEWHPTKNGNIMPSLVMAETPDQYYWLCPKGHTYKASVKNRVRMHSNCPYCSGQKVLKGFNDLETTHPEIALDYDDIKNKRKSYEVSKGCSDYFWFKCHKCGYEFKYQLSTYVSRGGKCPFCSEGKTKFQKVLKWETKELFDTLPLAAKSIEPNASEYRITQVYKNIFNACSGNTSQAYGFHWFYVNVDKDGKIIDDLSSFELKNTDKHITGQTRQMKNGQKATVIRDDGHLDIDIQFEDGTIVHTRRQSFRSGVVRNPNYSSMINKVSFDVTGEKMTIIGYRDRNDIDVSFENGDIIKNTTLAKFKSGTVRKKATLNHTRKSIVGTTSIMKHDEKATCINDNGWNDIDICFEDGTIVKHISRQRFLKGCIENPNFILSYLGKQKKMNCGLICTITEVTSKNDISVLFEDGDIVEHTSISRFESGTILTNALSHNYKYITGQRKLMKCGLYATVIADRGSHDIDVKFDDGTIVYNKDRANFHRGNISIPRSTSLLGMTKMMNNGLVATVIADNGWDNIDVKFENGVIVQHRRREHFKKGSISF